MSHGPYICQKVNNVRVSGKFLEQISFIPRFVVVEVETGCDGGAHECEFTTVPEDRALPGACRNDVLRVLAVFNVGTENDCLGITVRVKEQHRDRIAEVEMEDFIDGETVNSRKGVGCKEIVDGGRVILTGSGDNAIGAVRFTVPASFEGKRFEVKQFDNLFGSHGSIVQKDEIDLEGCNNKWL